MREQRTRKSRGFTLVEMLVSVLIFTVLAGAALGLVANSTPVFNRQQNFSGLNISMRNAVAQLQLDVVNAGTGYYPGTDIPDWPVGLTIVNSNPSSPCNTASTFTYSSTCFDTLNIITTDSSTPAAHPDSGTFSYTSADCIDTDTASTMYVAPMSGLAASNYHSGDELLLVNTGNSQMTTIKLTSAGSAYTSGGVTGIKFTFNSTTLDTTAMPNVGGLNTPTNDPLGITTCLSTPTTPATCASGNYNTKIHSQFCSTDWIMRLAPITYQVDTSTATNPKLDRIQGGTTNVLAEQIIGFKVGAVAWNTTDDTAPYSYCGSNAYNSGYYSSPSVGACSGYSNEWWLVRSVQVSLLGRTTPVTDPTYTYRNGFDGGHYQIESVMATVNPRNLSMNNN